LLLTASCGGKSSKQESALGRDAGVDLGRDATVGKPAVIPVAGEPVSVGLDAKNFTNSPTIDNSYWPLKPGTQWVFEGHVMEGKQRIERRQVFTITDLTKTLGGIRTVIAFDQDYNDGELIEPEIDFFAQDNDGNVWQFGEYVEVYEDGDFVGGQTWLAGYLEGAKAGIMMQAHPSPSLPVYPQGFAPAPFNWDDHAKIQKVDDRVCVPAGCYHDVLVIKEFEPAKPGIAQLKYYAPGVGQIKVGAAGKDAEREVLELVKVNQLAAGEMSKVREAALTLEYRATVFGRTPPAESRQ
jgi:hypothetical protein